MNQPFRIEKKERFRIIGYVKHTTNQRRKGRKDIPIFWENVTQAKLQDVLLAKMNQEPFGLFGISVYQSDTRDNRKFDYYIGVSSDKDTTEDMQTYEVPAATWAIFPCTLETMGKTQAQAITKWLPKAGYKPLNKGYLSGLMKSGAPDIEFYGKDDTAVWIAVAEKKRVD